MYCDDGPLHICIYLTREVCICRSHGPQVALGVRRDHLVRSPGLAAKVVVSLTLSLLVCFCNFKLFLLNEQ